MSGKATSQASGITSELLVIQAQSQADKANDIPLTDFTSLAASRP